MVGRLSGCALLVLLIGVLASPAGRGSDDCYSMSLHSNLEGIRYWYEEAGGFAATNGIPFGDKSLDCTKCHARTCDPCHRVTNPDGTCAFSAEKPRQSETCLPCHERERATIEMLQKKGLSDVHFAAGMTCTDCHSAAETHGTGQDQLSMYDLDRPHVTCTNCHADSTLTSRPHTVHGGKVSCAACHVPKSLVCYNCHMDSVAREGTRDGNYVPFLDWTFLVNYDGQVTSGSAVTLVSGGHKFVAYSPYFTHAVQPQALECNECHGQDGAKRAQFVQEPLPMVKYVDNQFYNYNGVMPLVPPAISWWFLEKENGLWMMSTNPDTAQVQLVGYCTPLTVEQVNALAQARRPY